MWIIGVTNKKVQFVALVDGTYQAEAKERQFFVGFDMYTLLTTPINAYKTLDLVLLCGIDNNNGRWTRPITTLGIAQMGYSLQSDKPVDVVRHYKVQITQLPSSLHKYEVLSPRYRALYTTLKATTVYVTYNTDVMNVGPPPCLIKPKVRCSAHGPSFARLQ